MAQNVTSVSRWQIGQDDARRIVRDSAARLRQAGAQNVQIGTVQTGQGAGETLVIVTYQDFESYGRAQQKLQQDQAFQNQLQEAQKIGRLISRQIITAEEIG